MGSGLQFRQRVGAESMSGGLEASLFSFVFFLWGLPLGVLGGSFPCGSLGSREGLLASSLRSVSHSSL